MRELSHNSPKRRIPIAKIIVLTIITSAITFLVLKFFKLDPYIYKGPKTVVQLLTDSGLKSDHRRTNVLLLGIGGRGHEGPNLSDTMILASINKDNYDVVLISIPRDLWVPSLSSKINSAYAYGEEKNGEGLEQASKTVEELLGLPVHYAFRLDFNGFTKAIDIVGGLDIEVETPFVDEKYPIPGKENETCGYTIETNIVNGFKEVVAKDATGSSILVTEHNDPFTCRYEKLTFQKGVQQMDGATALKFVRSRHGTNNEGSDFARSARQQKVIVAFREKVISAQTILDPKTALDLAKNLDQSIDTNIKNDDVSLFAKLGLKVDTTKIRRIVLDVAYDGVNPNSPLEVGKPEEHGGQFTLVPKNNVWTDLAEYIQSEVFKLEEK